MNDRIKIAGFIMIAIFYGLFSGVLYSCTCQNEFNYRILGSQEEFFIDGSNRIFSQTSKTESSLNLQNTFPVKSVKKHFNRLYTLLKVKNHIIKREAVQFSIISERILIHFRKNDHIYPFHYFW